jgi:predicted methyltransferase
MRILGVLFLAAVLIAQPLPVDAPLAVIRADEQERDTRERLPEITEALGIKPGSVVADIGTGYGYYAVRFSLAVGPAGRIYAEEIDAPLVEKLRRRLEVEKLANIRPVLGKPDDPALPASLFDAVLIADVYHEVDSPATLLPRIKASLKPGGRLMVIEYLKPELRSEARDRQRSRHYIAPDFVEQDLKAAGFAVIDRRDPLGPGYDGIPTYYILAAPRPD